MHMLYDSESFVVVHMLPDAVEKKSTQVLNDTAPAIPQLARHGFEIVDKRSGKEVYLDGSWAEMFQEQILAWQRDTPTQEEVEDALDRYAGLAQNPVVVHESPLRRCAPSPQGDAPGGPAEPVPRVRWRWQCACIKRKTSRSKFCRAPGWRVDPPVHRLHQHQHRNQSAHLKRRNHRHSQLQHLGSDGHFGDATR